jgi:hypothetical protein
MKGKTYNLFFYFFIFFILCLFFIFIFNFNLNLKESMTNNDTIILIGDSILNNEMYVPVGKSVADNIKLLHGNNLIVGAKDGATIHTCYHQLNMNNLIDDYDYFLFISIGGNDILNDSFESLNNGNSEKFDNLKKKYVKLIEFVKKKYPKIKINLLNLYFPTDEKYNKYKKIITEWNKMISSLCSKNNYNLLQLDNLLTNAQDFTHGIEPSVIGSEKIAKLIVNS